MSTQEITLTVTTTKVKKLLRKRGNTGNMFPEPIFMFAKGKTYEEIFKKC